MQKSRSPDVFAYLFAHCTLLPAMVLVMPDGSCGVVVRDEPRQLGPNCCSLPRGCASRITSDADAREARRFDSSRARSPQP